ncbi:MAG TPA: hypothetical protein VGX96_10575 [Candidatus Elarobacter sp.]|jgi:hypothetical protein|nr:hypothetical protein [Candidatus Elarobacter sp.]
MSNRRRLLTAAALVLATGLVVAGPNAQAQSGPKYKVGDRVEVDTIEASSPSRAIWKKGRVIKVDLPSMAYVVQVDPIPGQLPKLVTIPIRPYAEGWIHLTGGAAPHTTAAKLRVAADGTVLADRPLLDCEHLGQPAARNGQALPAGIARTLIRCLYEKRSAPGSDGATTMDVREFSMGAPHRWNKNVDSGPGGTVETLVYPVRVSWDQTTFYRTYDERQTGNARVFTCYVNIDQWFCGSAQYLKDGTKQQIPVQ